jgi:hypothetical protein
MAAAGVVRYAYVRVRDAVGARALRLHLVGQGGRGREKKKKSNFVVEVVVLAAANTTVPGNEDGNGADQGGSRSGVG